MEALSDGYRKFLPFERRIMFGISVAVLSKRLELSCDGLVHFSWSFLFS